MRRLRLALLVGVIGCSGASANSLLPGDATLIQSLTGAWDASLSLTRPYQLGPAVPASTRICGRIGFVENGASSGGDDPQAESVGVYDLELRRIGLDWLGDNSFPKAVVTRSGIESLGATAEGDWVTIVLNPGSTERIVLVGRHRPAGIDGDWVAQSARGTSTGHFSLRPHAEKQRSCSM